MTKLAETMTIFVDAHPGGGYTLSSLLYADDDDDRPDSGPNAEAATRAEAVRLARQWAASCGKYARNVEVLVDGNELPGFGRCRRPRRRRR